MKEIILTMIRKISLGVLIYLIVISILSIAYGECTKAIVIIIINILSYLVSDCIITYLEK